MVSLVSLCLRSHAAEALRGPLGAKASAGLSKHCPGHLNYQVWPYQISLPTRQLLNTARDEQVRIIFFSSRWTTSLT